MEDWDVQLAAELEDAALKWCCFVRAGDREEAVRLALAQLSRQFPQAAIPEQ